MGKKAWKRKILAGILCASLVFQSVSVTSFAEESTQGIQTEEAVDDTATATEEAEASEQQETEQKETEQQETEQKETEQKETEQASDAASETGAQEKQTESASEMSSAAEDSTEESGEQTETATDETTVAETETIEETTAQDVMAGEETRQFENVKIAFYGFKVYVESAKIKKEDNDNNCNFYLIQYKGDQKIGSSYISVDEENGYYVCGSYGTELYAGVDRVILQARIYDSSSTSVNIDSDPIARTNEVTDLRFDAKDVTTGSGSLKLNLSYTGDMKIRQNYSQYCNVYLYYGTDTDEENWQSEFASVSYSNSSSDSEKTKPVTFTGLPANAALHGKVVVRIGNSYQDEDGKTRYTYEQEIPLADFTTKEDQEYKLSEAFPDEVLREKIKGQLSVAEDTVKQSQLEKITYMYAGRYSASDAAMKDLTGVDLLTNLENLYIANHEISDVTGINWAKLTELQELNLSGNDLTALPDLTRNTKLQYFDVKENLLPESEVSGILEKLPEGYQGSFYMDDQRTGGFAIVVEPEYYRYGEKSPLLVKPQGYKKNLDYTLRFSVDGKEMSLDKNYNIYQNFDTGLSLGKHVIKAELMAGTTVVATSPEIEFSIVQQDVFVSEKKYCSSSAGSVSLSIFANDKEGRTLSKAELIDSTGKTVGESSSVYTYEANYDLRYTLIGYVSSDQIKLVQYSVGLVPYKYTLEAGSYDVRLIYSDGSSDVAEDVVEVVTTGVITSFGVGSSCDNTSDYFYLNMQGTDIEPDKLEYAFRYNGALLKASYVSSKETYSGVIAKLKKEDWNLSFSDGKSVEVLVTPKSGYDIMIAASGSIYVSEGIFYVAYNLITGKLEAGLSSSLGKGEVAAQIKADWNESSKTLATATAQLNDDGLVLFEMHNPDGTLWKPEPTTRYYLYCTYDGRSYSTPFWSNVGSVTVNSWSAPAQVIQGTGENSWFYYYEGAAYDSTAKYESTITGDTLSAPIEPETVNAYNSDYSTTKRTTIGLEYNLSKLAIGTYTINLTKNGRELSKREFSVIGEDKFILTSYYAYWDDDDTIRFSLESPNYRKDDNSYKVTLTDPYGNEVRGLTTKLVNGNVNYCYLEVTGLNRLSAYRQYYVKISHNTLGEAVKTDLTTPYFTGNGELKSITLSMGGYSTSDNRVIGIHMKNAKLPARLLIYKSYNAEQVISESITSVNSSNYYYFTKELYDKLPDKDALYDIVVVDSGDWVYTIDDKNIGYRNQISGIWGYSISSTTLYLSHEELSKATITVAGNKAKPTFKSSDSKVVKVSASATNANVAELEAVGLGAAEISITADGMTQKVTVKVVKLAQLSGIAFNKDKLTLSAGSQGELILNAVPVEAWDSTKEIEVSSSDTGVISVEQQKGIDGEAARVVITAVKEGTATITASVKGTDFAATAEVTVEAGDISEEEKAHKIEDVGTLYALTNSVATLKDVTLPKGWTWISGSEKLEPDERVQAFQARYTGADGKSFTAPLPLAVAELTEIKATTEGTGFINPGKSITYTLAYSLEGYQEIPEGALVAHCTIQWDLSKGTCVSADATNWSAITLTAKQAGTQEIPVTVKTGNDSFTDQVNVTVAGKDSVNRIEITAQQAAENGIACVLEHGELSVNTKDFKAGEADSIVLSAKTFVEDQEVSTGVEWATSDENVATVTAAGVITIKKAGTAVVSATAADEGNYCYSIRLSVNDYAPILDNAKITINKNLESVELPFYEQNGNHITDVEVYEGESKSPDYEASVEDCTVILKLRENSALRSSTKSVKRSVTFKLATERGTYEQSAEITLVVKKISVKCRQTKKANLFYTDSEAVFEISSAYQIANVEETSAADAPGFHLAEFDQINGTLTFRSQGITKENYTTYKNSEVSLKVTFSDFAGSVTVPVKINTENKKPSLAINNATVYHAAQTELTTVLVDKKTKEPYVLSKDIHTINFKPSLDKNGNGVTGVSISTDGCLSLTVKGTKSTSYKLTLDSTEWTQSLALSGKVPAAKQPVLVLGTKSVILNKAHYIQSNGRYIIPVSVKDSELEVWDVYYSISGSQDGVPALSNNLYVGFNSEKQQLEIGLNKGNEGVKAGKYKITVKAKAKGVGEVKSASFNLTIADKAVSAKLSAKGSINLADRAGTSIIYTPKLSNVSAIVEHVELTGDDADAFEATVVDGGKIEVKAVPGFCLNANVKYETGMILTLDNDSEISTSVSIKPVNKLPKVKASVTKGTLYQASDRKISTDLIITQKAGQNFEIDKVRLAEDQNSKYFRVSYSSDKKVTISLSDKASGLKAGKYTVKYNVFFKDAASNAKPVSMKMTVTVK